MILLVSATQLEVQPLLPKTSIFPVGVPFSIDTFPNVKTELLITGVGSVSTSFFLTKAIETKKYSFVINLGIAGSFNPNIKIGEVVILVEDVFADLGVDNRGSFTPAHRAGLVEPNEFPYENGKLTWPYQNSFPVLEKMPKVSGITVSTATGSERRIADLNKYFSPDIETMESAAVFYCCLLSKIPFFCLRSISNVVEPRDVGKWNIPLAVEKLNEATRIIIEHLKIVY